MTDKPFRQISIVEKHLCHNRQNNKWHDCYENAVKICFQYIPLHIAISPVMIKRSSVLQMICFITAKYLCVFASYFHFVENRLNLTVVQIPSEIDIEKILEWSIRNRTGFQTYDINAVFGKNAKHIVQSTGMIAQNKHHGNLIRIPTDRALVGHDKKTCHVARGILYRFL